MNETSVVILETVSGWVQISLKWIIDRRGSSKSFCAFKRFEIQQRACKSHNMSRSVLFVFNLNSLCSWTSLFIRCLLESIAWSWKFKWAWKIYHIPLNNGNAMCRVIIWTLFLELQFWPGRKSAHKSYVRVNVYQTTGQACRRGSLLRIVDFLQRYIEKKVSLRWLRFSGIQF